MIPEEKKKNYSLLLSSISMKNHCILNTRLRIQWKNANKLQVKSIAQPETGN